MFSAPRFLALLAAIALTACDVMTDEPIDSRETTIDSRSGNFITIQTTRVQSIEISEPIYATGTTAALRTTDLKPMVSGLVEKVYVQVGDRIKKGQPLFKIRQTQIMLRIAQLQHRVALARAELKNAKQHLETNIGLTNSGVISQEVKDDTQTQFDIARARLGIAETQLLEAKQNLEDSEGKAPFDGVVTVVNIQEGSFSSMMSMGSMGGLASEGALQVQEIGTIVTMIRVPESELSRIRIGSPAKITIDSLGKTFESQIHVINDLVDFASRTIDVRLGIKNDDYMIKPGLFARVEIFPEPRTVLVLPRRAVLGSGTHYVFSHQQGIAQRITVTIRELDTQRVEITSGVKAGQTILFGNDLGRLTDGAAIIIKEL